MTIQAGELWVADIPFTDGSGCPRGQASVGKRGQTGILNADGIPLIELIAKEKHDVRILSTNRTCPTGA